MDVFFWECLRQDEALKYRNGAVIVMNAVGRLHTRPAGGAAVPYSSLSSPLLSVAQLNGYEKQIPLTRDGDEAVT